MAWRVIPKAPGVDEPLEQLRSGTTVYYDQDGLASVTSISNSSGVLANSYIYTSFGNLTTFAGSVSSPLQYTGRDYDSESSLRYYRARYYDPAIGRFISEDPLRFGGGDTDFYTYVHDNPINYKDPSGKTKVHGNWCGPNWTGGRVEEYSAARDKDGYYKEPIDAEDKPCKTHDICYFDCRATYPCDRGGRKKCLTGCDNVLVADMPHSKTGDVIAAGIFWHPADPESNEHCGCRAKERVQEQHYQNQMNTWIGTLH